MDVVDPGPRFTPARIVKTVLEEGMHLVGLSILSGRHVKLVGDVMDSLRSACIADVSVVVGCIIPAEDAASLRKARTARAYSPKNVHITATAGDIVAVVDGAGKEAA